jgi:competence protein ComEC
LLKLKIALQSNLLFIIILLLSFIFCFIKINFIKYQSKYNLNTKVITGYIVNISYKNNVYKLTINSKEKVICTYFAKKKLHFKLGETLKVFGIMKTPSKNTIPNTFNYHDYLYNHQIYFIMKVDKIMIINNKPNFIFIIKNYLLTRINTFKYTKNYLKAFIIGDKSELTEYETYQKNGVSHLFAISGMHIGLLSAILLFVLKKNRYKYLIVIIFLIFYMFITNYSASMLRSLVFFILLRINNQLDLNITTKNILLLTISLLIFFNPLIIYDMGFIYSATVTFGLIISTKYYKKNYFYNLLVTILVATLFSLPITIYYNYYINLLSVINNLIIVPIVSFIVYPLCLLTLILKFLEPILFLFIQILEVINNFLYLISINISIPKVSILFYLVYYVILFLFIKSNNYKILLLNLILISSFKLKPLLDNNKHVYFLSVGQGDSTLIHTKNTNILIDTGGLSNYNISDSTITFMRSLGINHLDILLLTHGDYDHIGDATNLINNFKVDEVIFNKGEYNDLEVNLIQLLKEKNIKYSKGLKEYSLGGDYLTSLDTKIYNNENNNSNVLYFKYNNYNLLFMGDAGVEREKDIINKYNLSNIDFIKIGHHGSNTSSSKYFIDNIKPKYCIISVGKNNIYGLPKKSTLNILKNCHIYRTDINGSIEIKFNKDGYKVSMCPP